MLNEIEAKKQIELALNNAKEYIKNEQNFVFNREKIEDCLRKRSEYLGLAQKIYWLDGLSEKSLNSLESSLESSLGSSLGSSLESSLESSLWSSLGSSLESSLWSSLESSLRSSFRSSLGSSLESSLESSLWSSLGSSFRSSLGSSLGSSFSFIWWDSEYLAANDKKLTEYSKFMKEAISYGLGFVFDREKAIIAIPMPRFHKDNNRRLHNENGAAVIWNDGYEQYYLWGVKFDEKLYNQIIQKKLSAKEILKLENMEQRMTALKILGTEKLLEELNAKLLDKSGLGNELYLVENVFNQPAFFLKYSCPSTGRIYVSGVDPLIKNNPKADFAMSWKYGLTLDDYLGITNQT